MIWMLAMLAACGIVQTPPAGPEPRSLLPAIAACHEAPAADLPALAGGAPNAAASAFEPQWLGKAPVVGKSLNGRNPFVLPVPAEAKGIGQPSGLRAMYALGRTAELQEADAWVVCVAPKLGGFVFSGGEAMVVVPGADEAVAALRVHVRPDERVSRVSAPHWCRETTSGTPGHRAAPGVVSVLSLGLLGSRSSMGTSGCGPEDVSDLEVEEGDLAAMDCVVVGDADVGDRGISALAKAKAKVDAVCTTPIRPDEAVVRERITSEDYDLARDAGLFLGWNDETIAVGNRMATVWAEDEAWAASVVRDDLAALPPLGTPVLLSPDLVAQVSKQWDDDRGTQTWLVRFETHALIPATDQNAVFVDVRKWLAGLAIVYTDGHQQLLSLETQSAGEHRLWATARAELQPEHGSPQFINFFDVSTRVCGRARVPPTSE